MKFALNFHFTWIKKPAKDRGCGSTGLDATPTVLILLRHPVVGGDFVYCQLKQFHDTIFLRVPGDFFKKFFIGVKDRQIPDQTNKYLQIHSFYWIFFNRPGEIVSYVSKAGRRISSA